MRCWVYKNFETRRGIGYKFNDISLHVLGDNLIKYHESINPINKIDMFIQSYCQNKGHNCCFDTSLELSYDYYSKTSMTQTFIDNLVASTNELPDSNENTSAKLLRVNLNNTAWEMFMIPRRYKAHLFILQINEMPDEVISFCEKLYSVEKTIVADNLVYLSNKHNQSIILLRDCNVTATMLENTIRKIYNMPDEYGCVLRVEYNTEKDEHIVFNNHLSSNSIDSQISTLIDTSQKINDYLKKYRDALMLYTNQIKQLEQTRDKMLQYAPLLDTIKKCNIDYKLGYEQGVLNLTIHTSMFNFDETLAKKTYDIDAKSYCKEVMYMYKKCFIDTEWELLTTTNVSINTRNNSVCRSNTAYENINDYLLNNSQNMIPNPHIQGYNCFGQNGPVLTKMLIEQRYEEFIYCLKATLGNLNFNDSVVKRLLFKHWWNNSEDEIIWCRNIETGELYTKGDIKKQCTTSIVE